MIIYSSIADNTCRGYNPKYDFLHLWTFKTPNLVFIILVFSYLIFLNIFGLSIICSI